MILLYHHWSLPFNKMLSVLEAATPTTSKPLSVKTTMLDSVLLLQPEKLAKLTLITITFKHSTMPDIGFPSEKDTELMMNLIDIFYKSLPIKTLTLLISQVLT